MHLKDLECELFIEDLGNIQGGMFGPITTAPEDEMMVTTAALGEESGIEPQPPVNPVDGLADRLTAEVQDTIKSSLSVDFHQYLPF